MALARDKSVRKAAGHSKPVMTEIDHSAGLTESRPEPAKSVWIAAGVLALVTLAVFWRVTGEDFVHWDDKAHVISNPYLHRLDRENLLHFWKEPYEHLYIPLSYMAFALLCAIARMPHRDTSVTAVATLLNPHIFHTANLILHIGNSLLVFAILRLLMRLREPENGSRSTAVPALIGALIFAIHPLQVESVAWISELRGQLSSVFCLGSIYAYVAAVRHAPDGPWKLGRYWGGFLLTVLGLLCKPSIITVGLLLLVIDRWIAGRSWRASFLASLPWLLLIVPFTLITQHAQPVSAEGSGALWQRPFIAGDALAFYLGKLFAPVGLAIEYGRRPDVVLGHTWGYLTWLAPAAVAALIFVFRRGRPWLVAAGLIAIAVLLPVLGLTPFAFQNYSTVADRYVYLAMLGPAIIAAFAVRELSGRGLGRPAIGVGIAVAAALGVVSMRQVRFWTNSLTLFAHAVRINPNGYGLRNNYGISLDDLGKPEEAIAQYKAAVRINPNGPDAYQNIGISLAHEGKSDEALSYYRMALDADPNCGLAHAAIGWTLLSQNKPAEALPELEAATKLIPNDVENHAHYATALQELGRTDEAVGQFQQALAIDPSDLSALIGLAGLDDGAGRLDRAESECRRAIEISPRNAKALATLADVLQKQGQTDQAIALYRQALADDPTADALHFMLGSALFMSGDHAGAIPELAEAVRINPSPYHHDQLGVAYATVGNFAAAKTQFAAAVAVDPHYAPALKHLSMLVRH